MTREMGPPVQVKFRRDLGLLQVTMIGLGPTIGTTIFLLVGPGIAVAGGALLLAFVLNLVVTVFTAMAYAELSSSIPETGGGYLWIKTAMKEPWGFLGGWMSWFGHCVVCAFYIVSFGLFAVFLLQDLGFLPPMSMQEALWPARAISLPVLAVFLAVNYRGTRSTGHSSSVVTAVLLGTVGLFLAFGLLWFSGNAGTPEVGAHLSDFFRGGSGGEVVLNVLLTMGLTFVVFEGYEIIAQCGEECRDPARDIPRATWLTLSIATTIFVLVGFVTVAAEGTVFGGAGCSAEQAVACAANTVMAPFLFRGAGFYLITFGVFLGSLAALNSLIFSSSRVSFAMGRDGALPRAFGRLHPKKRTPHVAILSSGLIIGLMIVGLDIIGIAASADVMFLVLFLLVNWSVIVLRKKLPDIKRPYKMPLFPAIPLVGMASKGLLAVALVLLPVVGPLAWGLALAWIALGLAIHYLWAKKEKIVEAGKVAVEALVPMEEARYRILVPVEDFEDRGLVEFAALVAKVERADLQLLHVIEVPDSLPVDAIDSLYMREVRGRLAKLGAVAQDRGVAARATVVVSHHLFEAVQDVIRDEKTDLLILGWRGRWRKGRILGENVDRFVQNSPCDVTVLKSAGLKEEVRSILVMNAPEWHVSYATGYAAMLAKHHRAKVLLFTAATTEAEMAKERTYSARLALLCRTHGVPCEETFVRTKDIAEAVLQEAQGHNLLVLGATGEWTLLQNAFGAVQDQIARRFPGPVLMVRKVQKRG